MPLDKSGSKASVGKNISAEEAAGRPHKQAVAIALHTQDEAKHKHPHYNSIYRPGHKESTGEHVTSDASEKLNIKGVPAEHIRLAIQKLSTPKHGASFTPRVRLSHKV